MSMCGFVGIDIGSCMVSRVVGYLSGYSDVVKARLVSIGCWI